MTTLVQMLQPYQSAGGLLNAGEVVGLNDTLAATLVARSIAVEVDKGSGAGVPTASAFRGILASETAAQYATAGGTLGAQKVRGAVEGFTGATTIVDGRAVPNSEPWA